MLAAVVAGCAATPSPESRRELQAGYQALGQQDYNAAMAHADRFLREHPSGGPGTAEALYLEGRVYEQRAATDEVAAREAESKLNLQYARGTYERGLTMKSSQAVTALLHAGVANAAYFQEDYSTAMEQWGLAYPGLQQADARAWVLYRIGLCQQRVGRFDQADRSFALVRQEYPGSVPAGRAATRIGAKAFFVQIGAYSDAANADKAVAALHAQGLRASKSVEGAGRQAVRVGPAYTYAEAKSLQGRLLGAYPGAIIEP